MRNIKSLISEKDLKSALSLLDNNDYKEILKIFSLEKNSQNINVDSLIAIKREKIYLFTEEFISIDHLKTPDAPITEPNWLSQREDILSSSSIKSILYGIYSAILPPKVKKLRELYNIRTYVGLTDNKIAYKSVNNLDREIARILNKSKFSNLKNFLLNHNFVYKPVLAEPYYAREFLNINGITANMFKSKAILVYSALLNYDWEILSLEFQVDGENEPTSLAKIIKNEGLMTNAELTKENWSNLSILFELFLDQLLARTIHYDN